MALVAYTKNRSARSSGASSSARPRSRSLPSVNVTRAATAVTLAELRACGHLDAALAAERRTAPVMPQVTVEGATLWLTVPGLENPP